MWPFPISMLVTIVAIPLSRYVVGSDLTNENELGGGVPIALELVVFKPTP
jgi:hypothetical protein